MPRTPTVANPIALNTLKHLVKLKSNLKCTSFPEIQQLHICILNATGGYLSVQTLSRILGLVQTHFRPSMHTLNVLSRYINYRSFHDFQYIHESENEIANDRSHFVSSFFNTVFSGINDRNNAHDYLLQNIFAWMHAQPQFTTDIYTGVSSTPYGRKIFFQDVVNIDAFNNGFGKGLHHYLLHTKDREEKLLAHALNCLRYFLNNDAAKFSNCFKYVRDYSHEEIISFHPVVIDRFYAAVILDQSISNYSTEVSNECAMRDLDILASSSLSMANGCFHVGEAYLLAGDFNKANDIFESCSVKDLNVPEKLKPDYLLQLKIFKTLSGFFSGSVSAERARALIHEIELEKLPLLQKDYLSLLLLRMKCILFPKLKERKTILDSMNMLVDKTGFLYFQQTS